MSLSLIQGYSSAEEEEGNGEDERTQFQNSSDDDDEENDCAAYGSIGYNFDLPKPSNASGLPSAFDVFSQISGPPQFLNNSVEEKASEKDFDYRQSWRRNRKNKQDLPTGAVMEAKAQLVGIHERVRSDIEGNQPPASVSSTTQGVKLVATATNPNTEDAAELLRMCLQCGIPKTFSHARGMVCPICGDRPPVESSTESKKKGSTIKDKEKSKGLKDSHLMLLGKVKQRCSCGNSLIE